MHNTCENSSKTVFTYGDNKIIPSHKKFFHVDTTHPNIIKAMIYLSAKVNHSNGCFRYIPESHLVNFSWPTWINLKAIRSSLISTDQITLKKFYSLPLEYRKRNTFAYLYDDSNDEYMSELDSAATSFESDDANIILFHPLGIHTGGYCYTGNRTALQLTIEKSES